MCIIRVNSFYLSSLGGPWLFANKRARYFFHKSKLSFSSKCYSYFLLKWIFMIWICSNILPHFLCISYLPHPIHMYNCQTDHQILSKQKSGGLPQALNNVNHGVSCWALTTQLQLWEIVILKKNYNFNSQ